MAACGYDKPNSANDANSGNNSGYITEAGVEARVTTASGDLTQALATFRAQLGDPANLIAGEQTTGRREINWDAVPAALTNLNNFPGDQFNRVVPRGQVFTTEGIGFRVDSNSLAELNPAYASEFRAFSPPKIFIAVGSRVIRTDFRVAGSTTPALTSGFGVVFSDVDVAGSTSLTFFDAQGRVLKEGERAGALRCEWPLIRRCHLQQADRGAGAHYRGRSRHYRKQSGHQRGWRRGPGRDRRFHRG
jgi:hypothetical protein